MGEQIEVNKDVPKKSWFEGLKSEFKKIIWPEKKSIGKQTTAVIAISFVLGVLITFIDLLVQYGIDFLIK